MIRVFTYSHLFPTKLAATLFLLLCWTVETPGAAQNTSQLIRFAGQQVRAVWVQNAESGERDVFCEGTRLQLWGLDTGDLQGPRQILKPTANYCRPVLTPDGGRILYSAKSDDGVADASLSAPVIYRTDWIGSAPVEVGRGYVTDVWTDSKTVKTWVYAAQNLDPSAPRTLAATRLVRISLDHPAQQEVVVEGMTLCPDNAQLSRSGAAMSVQAPWPKAGLFKLAPAASPRFIKRAEGCWTSMAPDDSELLWVFNTDHRSVTMIRRDAKDRWKVSFADALGASGREVYHPRWSNHPFYFCLTAPQLTGQAASTGESIIGQVVLGRLSADARKVEKWFQLTDGQHACASPDLWIGGGETHDLSVKSSIK